MAEYISREAAIANSREYNLGGSYDNTERAVPVEAINSIHAADVRPVVRCKDCRHRDPEDHKCDCGQLERAGCVFPVDDDYFCAYGEER